MKKLKRLKKILNFALCIVMVITIVQSVPQNVYATKKVKLNYTKKTLYNGDTLQLKLNNAKEKIIWSSYNNSIAKVNKNGKVTAVGEGKTEIHAYYKSQNKKCIITVKEKDYSNGISYDIVDIGIEHFIKVVNTNNIDVSVPLKIKQVDADGYTVKNFNENIDAYKNNTTYYYIGLIGQGDDSHDSIDISICDIVKKNKDLIQINTSTNIYTKEENGTENKYCDVILENNQKTDADYYRFSVLGKDESGNYIKGYVSDVSIPANSKVKDTIMINSKIQSVDVFLFENY